MDSTEEDEAVMPRVLNKYRDQIPSDAVNCMRPGPWGNPFVIGRDSNREQVLERYKAWIYAPEQAQLRERARRELANRPLWCCCRPASCHADILHKIANGRPPDKAPSAQREMFR